MKNKHKNPAAQAVGRSAWLDDDLPTGRWMTFDETKRFMVSFPLAWDMIWAGHKNNPRQSDSRYPVLSGLERVALLRHLLRRVELQMALLRLAATRIFRAAFQLYLVTLQIWLPCGDAKSSNDQAEPRGPVDKAVNKKEVQ